VSGLPDRPGSAAANLTALLNRMRKGDPDAANRAAEVVYTELHRLAAGQMRREKPGHALQTTALVHEAYLRLAGADSLEIQNRGHFFAVASQQMRRILVDSARRACAQKRGGGVEAEDIASIQLGHEAGDIDLLLLDRALGELSQLDARSARVVEMRYFGGYDDAEIAEALGVSPATVRRDWNYARTWLFSRIRAARPRRAAGGNQGGPSGGVSKP
jgi:RNA polymerase sigma factor (TIGR02999 family)